MTDAHEQSLAIYHPGFGDLPPRRREAWERFFDEARAGVGDLETSVLREWGRRSLAIAVYRTAARADALRSLVRAVAKGAWNEFKLLMRALFTFEISAYFEDACRRLWNALRSLWQRITGAVDAARDFVASLPGASGEELAGYSISFFGAVLGFVLIGGTGDGGIIDKDIALFGIGGHRSIWFHSAFIGLAAEVCFLSFFELARILHERLPRRHSPVWDRLLGVGERFTAALVTGSWAGVASHLVIDSHIDGWTPYKDLPVSLPNWGHHMIMDMNAAAAGWFGWQWHDKARRRFRDDRACPPSHAGKPSIPLVGVDERI